MVFQGFSKNFLNILMIQLFQHLSLVLPSAGVFFGMFSLDLNDSESAKLSFG